MDNTKKMIIAKTNFSKIQLNKLGSWKRTLLKSIRAHLSLIPGDGRYYLPSTSVMCICSHIHHRA